MKNIPAASGEIIQYMVHEQNDNTIRFVLEYPGLVDAAILQQATHALVQRAEVLHAAFQPGRIRCRWAVQDVPPPEACFTLVQAQDVRTAALEAAARFVDPLAGQQLHCTLVQGKASSALCLIISHLTADGADGKYLLHKLAEAYRLIRETGSASGLQVKNGDRTYRQCYGHLHGRDFRRLLGVPMKKATAPFPYEDGLPGSPRLTAAFIPAEAMQAARRRAKAAGASINDVLIAAMCHALADMPGQQQTEPRYIMGMMDIRRHCPGGDTGGLCNMTGTMAACLPQGIGRLMEDTVAQIAAQTSAAKADPLAGLKGVPLADLSVQCIPFALLLAAGKRIYGSMGMGLTNLGTVPGDALALDGLIPSCGLFGGPMKKKPGMQVSAASFGETCGLCVAGQGTEHDGIQLAAFLQAMAGHVAQYAANP